MEEYKGIIPYRNNVQYYEAQRNNVRKSAEEALSNTTKRLATAKQEGGPLSMNDIC